MSKNVLPKSVNLNDEVTFVLTEFGNEVWDKLAAAEMTEFHAREPRSKPKATPNPKDPTLKMQLWDWANFFGPKLFNGSRQIFVENTLTFKEQ